MRDQLVGYFDHVGTVHVGPQPCEHMTGGMGAAMTMREAARALVRHPACPTCWYGRAQ